MEELKAVEIELVKEKPKISLNNQGSLIVQDLIPTMWEAEAEDYMFKGSLDHRMSSRLV